MDAVSIEIVMVLGFTLDFTVPPRCVQLSTTCILTLN